MSDFRNVLDEIQTARAHEFRVYLDAEMWFGEESNAWTHQERVERINSLLRKIWQNKGGVGEHPMAVA